MVKIKRNRYLRQYYNIKSYRAVLADRGIFYGVDCEFLCVHRKFRSARLHSIARVKCPTYSVFFSSRFGVVQGIPTRLFSKI